MAPGPKARRIDLRTAAVAAAWLLAVAGLVALGVTVSSQRQRIATLEQQLEEKTGEFNGCLDSFNFCDHQLAVCRGEVPKDE